MVLILVGFFFPLAIHQCNYKLLEPLPPIFIRAPQPTVILRSDLNRLRAELNSRVRPPSKKTLKSYRLYLTVCICIYHFF